MTAIEFSGFRDLASPEEAGVALVELYGAAAEAAAGDCMASALADRRVDDYVFWLAVRKLLAPPPR